MATIGAGGDGGRRHLPGNAVRADIQQLLTTGCPPLPAQPDLHSVSDWSVTAHRRHWGRT